MIDFMSYCRRLVSLALAGVVLVACSTHGQAQEIQWAEGPQTVDIGDGLARLQISERYAFADGDDTRLLMSSMGNPPTGTEVGIVIPTNDNQSWFLVFDYNRVGYVKDDEKDQIDPDALLSNIREGTHEANKERAKMGVSPLYILGWYERPHYDGRTHNLVWAILAQSDGDSVVNYNTNILGREGYVSTVLVADVGRLQSIKREVATLMSTFSYNTGMRYQEFKKGDKVAKFGLTALIAGGAGAVAVKTGLFAVLGKFLAKLGKLVIVIGLALIAFLRKLLFGALRWLRGGSSKTKTLGPSDDDSVTPPPGDEA